MWFRARPARIYGAIAVALLLVTAAGAATYMLLQPKETSPVRLEVPIEKPKPVYYSLLTGEKVESETDITKPVAAVMIENSPDARPQSGLKDAEVVYEAIAEGGITRFLAIYQQNKPKLIGPVRSLRAYYVDWVTPYDASIVHVGGSQKALQTVRNGKYRDVDEFFNASYYWRATDRYAPHNVYTSSNKIDQLNIRKKYTTSNPSPFERGATKVHAEQNEENPDSAKQQPAIKNIQLKISGPTYNSSYKYDEKTKLYARSQAGAPHLDREAGQITARVVIALRVNMTRIMEDGYRESITTTGSNEATIFQNGEAIKARWHKDGANKQLYFTDENNQRIKLARGVTWISAIPTSTGDVSWQ